MSHHAEASDQELVLERKFNAPRAMVWAAVTEQKQLAEWWGPPGMEWVDGTLDLRPGGIFHFGMRSPNGPTMWGKWVYGKIEPPRRLEFVNSFADEGGNAVRSPFHAAWPMEIANVLTLEESAGKTTLRLRSKPLNASAEECAAFAASLGSLQQGFGGTFDRLETYLQLQVKEGR